MKLTIKDRIIILNTVLPQYDTRQNIELVKKIRDKISLKGDENSSVFLINNGNNMPEVGFKTSEAITNEIEFAFTNEELAYMKQRVDYIDQQGMFSESTMITYDKIIAASPPNT